MRNKGLALAALAILITVGSGCLFSESKTTIKGIVVKDGKPVEGVKVMLTGRKVEKLYMFTGDDGRFIITTTHRTTATLEVTAEKSGLKQSRSEFILPYEETAEEITIEMIDEVPAT